MDSNKFSIIERPRRSTANYNRSYALSGQGRKEGRDSRVTAELSSMDPVRRDGRDRESTEEAEDGTTAEGAVSRRAVMGVMVRMPVRVLVLCVGFVVASLQCTIIC